MKTLTQQIKEVFPNEVNNDKVRIYENGKKVYKNISTKQEELALWSLLSGRHHEVQQTNKMFTEYKIDLNSTPYSSKESVKLDVAFFDAKNKLTVIVENAIIQSTAELQVEKLIEKKFTQALNYALYAASSYTTEQVNDKGLIVTVNVYNKDICLSNNKMYETYMSSSNKSSKYDLFKRTGIYQKQWVVTKEQIETLQEQYNECSINEELLKTNEVLKTIYEKPTDSTNFRIIDLDNSKIVEIEQQAEYIIVPEQIKSNNLCMQKLPTRSVQMGSSPYDNTREKSDPLIQQYRNDMARDFWEKLERLNFSASEKQLNEMRRPGWHYREIKASNEQTFISNVRNRNVVVISTDIALNNSQHNSSALLFLKKDFEKITTLSKRIDYIKNELKIKTSKPTQVEINAFVDLIQTINPRIKLELYSDVRNGKDATRVDNTGSAQTPYDKAQFKQRNLLQILTDELNPITDDKHIYVGTDITQDQSQVLCKQLETFNISRIANINSVYENTLRIKKLSKTKSEIKSSLNSLQKNIKQTLLKKEDKQVKFVKLKKIFKSSGDKHYNEKSLTTLVDSCTVNSLPTKTTQILEEFINEMGQINGNITNNEAVVLKQKGTEILKQLKLSGQKKVEPLINQMQALIITLANRIEYDNQVSSEQINNMIKKLQISHTQVDTKKLIEMIDIVSYMDQYDNDLIYGKNQNSYLKDFINDKSLRMQLVTSIIAYQNLDLTLDNFKTYLQEIEDKVKQLKQSKQLPSVVSLRNDSFDKVADEQIKAIVSMYEFIDKNTFDEGENEIIESLKNNLKIGFNTLNEEQVCQK